MNTRIKPCENCGGTIGPDFYIVKVAQAIVDRRAIQRFAGLNAYFGGATAIAEIFSPDDTFENIVDGEDANKWKEVTLCQKCFMESPPLIKAFEKRREPVKA